jgi:hypothetical protein
MSKSPSYESSVECLKLKSEYLYLRYGGRRRKQHSNWPIKTFDQRVLTQGRHYISGLRKFQYSVLPRASNIYADRNRLNMVHYPRVDKAWKASCWGEYAHGHTYSSRGDAKGRMQRPDRRRTGV